MGRLPQFSQRIAKPQALPPEYNPWYWNPNRGSIVSAPSWFQEKLRELDGWEDLRVVWNPINQRWQVFSRAPRVNHPICQGWRLLFIHNGVNGEHLPLDERLLARLYWSSAAAYGSAKKYFDAIQREAERDKEAREKKNLADQIDMAMPYFEHSQIKVGYGSNNGSKFAKYHS